MALQATRSKKDYDGDIIGLCGNGWSQVKDTVVRNIRTGAQSYYVSVGGRQVYVLVGLRNGKDYLTTSADTYSPNNLDNLPGC